jgi:preprotein translocase subunit Sec63
MTLAFTSYALTISSILGYLIRTEYKDMRSRRMSSALARAIDYYEALQVNGSSDVETTRRVYRIMAAQFHPDNPKF